MKILSVLVVVLGLLAGPVAADPGLSGDVDADEFIVFGALQWAWASPCDGDNPTCAEPVTLHDGWRIPTVSEFTGRPSASLFAVGDDGIACATPWFQHIHTHCDFGDGTADSLWHPDIPGRQDNNTWETWLVRVAGPGAVPEPASLALLGLGLAGIAAMRRRKKA